MERIKNEQATTKPKGKKTTHNTHYDNDKLSMVNEEMPFDIPKNWAWCRLGEVGNIITGNTPSKSNKEYYGNDYPFFKPNDLDAGFYTTNSTDGLSKLGFEQSRNVPKNSILVTCIGTIGKIGFTRVKGAFNQQINAIIPLEEMNNEFLYFLILSSYIQLELKNNASATTIAILNKSKFENISIPLPPFSEQKRIVEKIEQIFSILEELEENLT